MNKNIQVDLQICISVPLKEEIINRKKLDDSNSKNSVNMPNSSEKENEKLESKVKVKLT